MYIYTHIYIYMYIHLFYIINLICKNGLNKCPLPLFAGCEKQAFAADRFFPAHNYFVNCCAPWEYKKLVQGMLNN